MVVLGGGAIGLLSAFVYRAMGVRQLRIAEPNALRRKMIASVIDAEAYDPLAGGPVESTVDMVCDAVGSGRTRAAARTTFARSR